MNSPSSILKILASAAAVSAFALVAPASAQMAQPATDAPATDQASDLPDAKDVIARYIEASGGEEAIRAVEKVRTVGTLEMPMFGVSGEMIILVDSSGEKPVSKATVTIEGIGEIESGVVASGKGYEVNPMQGTRLLTPEEVASRIEESDFQSDLDLDKYYSDYKTTGRMTVDGMETLVVEMTDKEGKTSKVYFAEGGDLDGLKVMVETVESTPMGDIPSKNKLSDYREVQGPAGPLKVSFKTEGDAAGNKVIITLKDVDLQADFTAADMAPPAEVEDMLKGEEDDAGMGNMDEMDDMGGVTDDVEDDGMN